MAAIKQIPTPPNEWLHNGAPDFTRSFHPFVIRPEGSQPWAECTNEQREQWEQEHPAPEVDNN